MAYFSLPDGWDFGWSALQILTFPGTIFVDELVGGAHGLGLVGLDLAFAVNFIVDWALIYLLMLSASMYRRKD